MVQRSTVLAGASGFHCSVARFVLSVSIFLRLPPPAHAFISITSGERHSCAIDAAEDVVCWGENDVGPERGAAFFRYRAHVQRGRGGGRGVLGAECVCADHTSVAHQHAEVLADQRGRYVTVRFSVAAEDDGHLVTSLFLKRGD